MEKLFNENVISFSEMGRINAGRITGTGGGEIEYCSNPDCSRGYIMTYKSDYIKTFLGFEYDRGYIGTKAIQFEN